MTLVLLNRTNYINYIMEKLLRFLAKEGLVEKYLDNFAKHDSSRSLKEFFVETIDENLIASAFLWDASIEGDNFWYAVDHQYQDYLMPF
jgi:hypothetical protein